MKFLSYSLLLSLLSTFFISSKIADFHEYYFSNMTMERNLDDWTLEVEIRLFSDDIEKALGESDDFHVRLGDEREIPEADSLLFDYIYDHVQIEGEGWEQAQMNYIGKQVDNDVTYLYVEYQNIKKWGMVEITNTILFDFFPGQGNQLTFINGGSIKTDTTYPEYPKRTVNLGE